LLQLKSDNFAICRFGWIFDEVKFKTATELVLFAGKTDGNVGQGLFRPITILGRILVKQKHLIIFGLVT
jgi:hypothetical protein